MIWDIGTSEDGDLLFTSDGNIEINYGHQAVSDLVRANIATKINWDLFDGTINADLLYSQIRFVVNGTEGVASVDMSGWNPQQIRTETSYGTICFTTDCGNSIETTL